jgi:hypothetical protein
MATAKVSMPKIKPPKPKSVNDETVSVMNEVAVTGVGNI